MAENTTKNDKRMEALSFIASINAIPGVDLTAVTREVASKSNPGEKENFLPLIWKKAWAREVYPLHRCHAETKEIKDGVVAAYAAFYVDNDPEKMPIGEGFAFVPIDTFAPDPMMARADAISLALGSAKSHAYTDAGFGLQFWTDDCIDDLQAASNAQMMPKVQAASNVVSPNEGEASNIPLVSGSKNEEEAAEVASMSLADMVGQADVPAAETFAPQRSRKSQYEVAKTENEEIVSLADQLMSAVACVISSSIGSTEHDAAQKTVESIHDKWRKLADDISAKMQKPSVQEAKSADEGYTFFAKTYDQVYAEAKDAARNKEVTAVEIPVSVPETTVDQTETVAEPKDEVSTNAAMSLADMVGAEASVPSMESADTMPVQETVFMVSVDAARSVKSTCGSYAGKSIGELFDNPVTKAILPKLFERTEVKDEKIAIKTLIESDEGLMAYCERTEKDLTI